VERTGQSTETLRWLQTERRNFIFRHVLTIPKPCAQLDFEIKFELCLMAWNEFKDEHQIPAFINLVEQDRRLLGLDCWPGVDYDCSAYVRPTNSVPLGTGRTSATPHATPSLAWACRGHTTCHDATRLTRCCHTIAHTTTKPARHRHTSHAQATTPHRSLDHH
jgi:hypothetical protein